MIFNQDMYGAVSNQDAPEKEQATKPVETTNVRRPLEVAAREWLAKFLPPTVELPSLDHSQYGRMRHWEPGANYVIAGSRVSGADALVLTFAENFAASGGHIIWIGITEDLGRLSERLMFKIAGLELATAGTCVQLDAVAQIKLVYARAQIDKLWIDFCNVEDCGDTEVEEEFLASMSSFKPTLIVVDESIFNEAMLDPLEVLVRQTHARHMVNELRSTNPLSSVLWHLAMPHNIDAAKAQQRPSLDDILAAASSIKPDVVMFTHRINGSDNAELIVAANAYGPICTVPMIFDPKRSTWHELDAVA